MRKVDYIIAGQGIAGSILAYELYLKGKEVIVVNRSIDSTSSKVAAGLYNPITGRKMVKTWRCDDLFDGLGQYYDEVERFLEAKFHHALPIYRPFNNVEEQNDWVGATLDPDYDAYVQHVHQATSEMIHIKDPFGGLLLKNSGYVDLPIMLNSFQQFLLSKGMYHEGLLQMEDLSFEEDSVLYKNYQAKKILFCEGTYASSNLFFDHLKFRPVKGEIMDIVVENQPEVIVNRGVFMLPKSGFVRVGSTYDNHDLTIENTEKGINTLKEKLEKIYVGPYRIIDMKVGIRPATFDRKPFIGISRNYQQIGIFNGFGAKGVSLVPFFAKLFVNHLLNGAELIEEVSIYR